MALIRMRKHSFDMSFKRSTGRVSALPTYQLRAESILSLKIEGRSRSVQSFKGLSHVL
jgi:hypothetical protein